VIGMLPLSGQRTIPDIALLPGFTTITKPVFPLELIDAMIVATDAETGDLQAATVKSQPTDDTLPPSGLRILVAEDTPFNQKFITRLFERWHLDLVIVENGRQAVEKQAQQPFDIVLMDVQMPEMDGFEASRLIRQKEAKNNHPRVPIIAMTAYAMKGDKERCLEAGMDGYVSKPISSELLKAEIIRFSTSFSSQTEQAVSVPGGISFDTEKLLRAFDNDMEFLKEAVGMFIEDYPPMLESIDQALTAVDLDELGRTAHGLKGMLGNFQADEAVAQAFSLENMGKDRDCSGGREIFTSLAQEVQNLEKAMTRLIEE
ncbi:MAG: response regulator, partial [Desulfobacterales bacterium]|nr:response regulator [Desulfobacterales bacterium]